MELKTAIKLVWDDVADSVYDGATLHEAMEFARVAITADELALVAEPTGDDDRTELVEAYTKVRAASEIDVYNVMALLA